MTTTNPFTEAYIRSAAEGMLESLEHYGYTNPPAGDGRVSTPAWYASRLGKVAHARNEALPGSAFDWWGGRYGEYAKQLLAELGTPVPPPAGRCAEHPSYNADYCPLCGTARVI